MFYKLIMFDYEPEDYKNLAVNCEPTYISLDSANVIKVNGKEVVLKLEKATSKEILEALNKKEDNNK